MIFARRLLAFGLLGVLMVVVWMSINVHRPGTPAENPSSPNTPDLTHNAPSPTKTPPAPATAPARTALPEPADPIDDETRLTRFDQWLERYLAADPQQRVALETEGLQLARERRSAFKQLIEAEPRGALEAAVSNVRRQQLPAAIVAQLEERVSRRADVRVYQGVPVPGEAPPTKTLTHRIAAFNDGTAYVANVYGRRALDLLGTRNDMLNGVAVDNQLALHDDPVRRMEPGEIPDPDKPVITICPVSGAAVVSDQRAHAPIPPQTIAVETPEAVVYLGSEQARETFITWIYAEGGSGGPVPISGILPAAPTPALGMLKVLFIPMTFADQNITPTTESKCYEIMREVGDYYAKSSYGKLTTLTTVTPPIKLPHDEAWYVAKDTSNGGTIDGLGLEHTHAREEAKKLGYDFNDYHCTVVRLRGGPRAVGGWGGGSSVWIYGDGVGTAAHEIGHAFGLGHANYWDTGGTSAIGAGANAEYGDVYDVMGSGGVPTDHFNAQGKTQLKWLPTNYVSDITTSGTYRVHAFDQPILEPANCYALRIIKDAQRTYWAEVRQAYNGSTSRPWADRGILLGWRWPSASGGNLHRIDTTPGSPFGKDDAAISLGRTFSDTEAGIHLTTIHVDTNAPKYVDVVVNFGFFPSNRPPTLSLAASADVVPTGTTVTFTATGTDPDGDPLAWSWQNFGDTGVKIVSPNSNVITRTFSTAGTYVVACTASDMKGGSTTRWRLITVGNGNGRYTIAGRVTLGGAGLADVIVNANGANSVVTDADGYYVIPNLTANTYAMTPLLYGYTFSEVFNNSVTVGPNFTGADFEAQATPVVTIAATAPNASEAGPTAGRFTITRTGDTAQPLTVFVNPAQGTATKTTDYTFSPDYVSASQGFSSFTILEEQSSLEVTVAPVNDTSAEGPETVILQLGPGNGYLVGPASSATVTIADNDTALPKVALSVGRDTTIEGSAAAASVLFTRTGPTTSPLTVNYTVGGTATPGADFTALPGSAVIPIGSSSALVEIVAVNNAVSEPLETVTVTTATAAAYLLEPAATTALVSIVDDEVPVVSVSAPDSSAQEVDLSIPGALPDTAVFLITRAGDASQPLTVYYSLSGPTTGAAALHGADFEPLPGSIVIPAGETSGTVTILPRYDSLGEGREYLTLQLGAGPTDYQLATSNSATVTIDDAPTDLPYVEVMGLTTVSEGSANGAFRISVKGAGTGTLTVNYTVSGTATAGADYTIAGLNTNTLTGSTNLTLNNGTVTRDLAVTRINDTLSEDLETVTLTLSPGAAFQTFGPSSSATLWLVDDEQPTVFVDAHSTSYPPSMSESGSAASFYLSRTGSTANPLTVNFTLGGTAVNGTDYNTVTGSATIPAGASGVDVTITPVNDTVFEGTETIVLALTPAGYGCGPAATMYLTDNETSTTLVSFAAPSAAGPESVSLVQIPVTLSAPPTAPVTVEYLVDTGSRAASRVTSTVTRPCWLRLQRAGNLLSAYSSANGTAWTPVGSTQTMALASEVLAGLAVSSKSDGSLSSATFDNFALTGSPTLQGRTIGFVNAQGSDSLASGVYTVAGSGAAIGGTEDECHLLAAPVSGDFTLTARVLTQSGGATTAQAGLMIRETPSHRARALYLGSIANAGLELLCRTGTVTTAYGAGVDFSLPAGTLTFGIGQASNNIPLTVVNDTIQDWDEQITVLLRNPNGAQLGSLSTFAYTIIDDDLPPALPSIGFTATNSLAAENDAATAILVALSTPSAATVTVDYSVSGGSAIPSTDYNLPADTLSFPPGSTVQSIPVSLVNDAAPETNKTIIVTLSNPAGAVSNTVGQHTLTIADDDWPVVTLSGTDTNAVESGDPGAFTFTRSGSLAGDLVVNLIRSGTATGGTDYATLPATVTITNGQPSATLYVLPTQDASNEGTETVVLSLSAGANYTVGSPASTTVNIVDDDRSTVTILATDAVASETPGNPGQFTLTRSAPTTASLAVGLTITGTAANTTDYATLSTTATFAIGQSNLTLNVAPFNDTTTEGPEQVVVQITSGSCYIGPENFATVSILDNDSPPSLLISSPAAQGPLIASGNGLILSATVGDDGAPQPLTLSWSQASGPGPVVFESPASNNTAVSFSSNGTYVLRATATDGQFTVSDQVTVMVGPAIAPADWISGDMTPAVSIRGQTFAVSNAFLLTGTGAGYAGTTDAAQLMVRQVAGEGSIVARLNSLTGASAPLAGVTIRDTLFRGARRAVLGYVPGSGLQFRVRATASAADTVTIQAGVTLPVWLRLDRNATSGFITAFYAADVSGSPGTWTPLGTGVAVTMDTNAVLGITATSNSSTTNTAALFDNLGLSPSGVAEITEDFGTSNPIPGTNSLVNGVYTIAASGSLDSGGYFVGRQYFGDFIVTAKLGSASSGATSAKSGIMVRESMDSGAYVFLGRIPTSSFSGYLWRSLAGGSSGGVPSFTQSSRWMRLVRSGNKVTAFHAPDVSGAPGAWIQIGQPQTVIMTTPVMVGLAVDNAGGTGLNTCTFSNLTVVPLNKAPIVDPGSVPAWPLTPVALNATVTDDNFPAPPVLSLLWSRQVGPGPVTFADPAALSTTAAFAASGNYTLRLQASDSSVQTFKDLAFTAYANSYDLWAAQQWAATGGLTNPESAPGANPDLDTIINVFEWIFGANPFVADPGRLPQPTVGPASFTLAFSRTDESESGSTLLAEWGSDLQSWNSLSIGAASSGPDVFGVTVAVVENGASPDNITVTIPLTNAPSGHLFIRLNASTP